EYVTRALHNRIAPYVGFTYLPAGKDDDRSTGEESWENYFYHVGAGINWYVLNKGTGLYFATGYDRVVEGEWIITTATEQDDWSNGVNLASLKLGYRLVENFVSTSLEAGYGLGFANRAPDNVSADKLRFSSGNWVLLGLSVGIAF
ncbi:hypothetical protein ACFL5V_13500, partial [Fibrobacterota bacterium]